MAVQVYLAAIHRLPSIPIPLMPLLHWRRCPLEMLAMLMYQHSQICGAGYIHRSDAAFLVHRLPHRYIIDNWRLPAHHHPARLLSSSAWASILTCHFPLLSHFSLIPLHYQFPLHIVAYTVGNTLLILVFGACRTGECHGQGNEASTSMTYHRSLASSCHSQLLRLSWRFFSLYN